MDKQTLKNLARIHWEKHRPRMVAHLKANQEYEAALENNALIASQVLSSKLKLGADEENARKYVLKTWIFLPNENTEPILDWELMPFSQPGEDIVELTTLHDPGKTRDSFDHFKHNHH